MPRNDTVWQGDALVAVYLQGIRGAVPLAQEQMDMMLRLVRAARPEATAVLDLGCGDGILGQVILDQYPEAHGVFLDFSAPMLAAAEKRLLGYGRCTIVQADYGQPGWQKSFDEDRFDVIVSGFSIHHQPDVRKQELYQELYDLLKPGGIFLNIEHVSSPTPWLEKQFDGLFIDGLYQYHQGNGGPKTREQLNREFYNRPDKEANILAAVELQCAWLREIGFAHVDCYLKILELAVFGGIKH